MQNSIPVKLNVPSPVRLAVLLLTMLALLIYSADGIWASSSDYAHHYSLVARLFQLWSLPPGVDPSLGEMNIYPRGSHVLSALVGQLFHSPFVGMHVVTLLSMMAIWTLLGALVLSLPKRAGLAALAILLVLLWLNYRHFHLDIYGYEDLANFFFAQLVAQGFMAGALLLALYLERRAVPPLLRYAVLAVAVFLVAGTHLLPASQLAAVTLALIALDFVLPGRRSPRAWIAGALQAGACMLVVVVVLVKHPAFAAMRAISQNDGELYLTLFTTPARMAAFGVLVLLASAALTLTWIRLAAPQRSQLLVLKYVGLFGLAAAALCLLQIALLHLGQGSLYAIKKHLFTLNSVFFLELALLPLLWPRWRAALAPAAAKSAGTGDGLFYSTLALPLLTVAAYASLIARPPYLDASDVARLEQLLELRRDTSLPQQDGKHTYVLDIPGVPGGIAYMMSIGVFSTPRTANSLDVLAGRTLTELDAIGTIITGADSSLGRMRACRLPGSDSQLAMVDGHCAYEQLALGSPRVGLGLSDGQPNCMLDGFSGAEAGGRWTAASVATMTCPVPKLDGVRARRITLSGNAFLTGNMQQRLTLRANGGPAHEFVFASGQPAPQMEMELPPGLEGKLVLQLSLPDAVSPKQLGLSGDDRKLGVMIRTLEFKP
jgi:hypothetical protein